MMLVASSVLNVVLAVVVLTLWSKRQKRDKSGRFKAKGKSKKQPFQANVVGTLDEFYAKVFGDEEPLPKDLTGDNQ
jgi:hypothetical protein